MRTVSTPETTDTKMAGITGKTDTRTRPEHTTAVRIMRKRPEHTRRMTEQKSTGRMRRMECRMTVMDAWKKKVMRRAEDMRTMTKKGTTAAYMQSPEHMPVKRTQSRMTGK